MRFWFYRRGYYSIEILFPVHAKKLRVLRKIKTDLFLGYKLLSRFKNKCDKNEFWIAKHSKYSKLLLHHSEVNYSIYWKQIKPNNIVAKNTEKSTQNLQWQYLEIHLIVTANAS